MLATRGRGGHRGEPAGLGCSNIGGHGRGGQDTHMQPNGRLGGAHHIGRYAFPGRQALPGRQDKCPYHPCPWLEGYHRPGPSGHPWPLLSNHTCRDVGGPGPRALGACFWSWRGAGKARVVVKPP